MGSVIGISNAHIRAVEGSEIPTFKVSGIVGMDFSGSDLADAVVRFGEARLILDSFGGSASDAFAFYDTIRGEGAKLHVDGRGTIASAATIFMAAAGKKRSRLYPNAEYLIHNASGEDADAVARANVKMQNIYMELTGMERGEVKALMAKDKTMSAADAKRLGFVGSVIELQKLAAHADKPKTMADETTKRVFAVDRDKALAAMVTGHIEIDVTAADNEMKAQLDAAIEERKGKDKTIDELKASVEGQPAAIAAAVDAAKKELKAQHDKDLTTLAGETDKLKAKIAELEKTPAVPAVKAAATTKVEDAPDADASPLVRFPKRTPEQLSASFQATRAKLREGAKA